MSRTMKEVQKHYLVLHQKLGNRKDVADKKLFDHEHQKIWHNCEVELKDRETELKSKSALTVDEQTELVALDDYFPKPSKFPQRDLAAQVAELTTRIEKLEKQ